MRKIQLTGETKTIECHVDKSVTYTSLPILKPGGPDSEMSVHRFFGCSADVFLQFFYDERRIILDNSWVHQHITSTLDYTNIQKLIFI
jgi:hypothetical protein